MKKYNTQALGNYAENIAYEYLKQQGLQLLYKNYRKMHGEIDLIMQDLEDIVFVEVRSRQSDDHGHVLESITAAKMKLLIRTAKLYLQETKWLYTRTSRFDIVLLHPLDGRMQLEWIKNAFTVERW